MTQEIISSRQRARQEQASSACPAEEAVFRLGVKASSASLPLMDISPRLLWSSWPCGLCCDRTSGHACDTLGCSTDKMVDDSEDHVHGRSCGVVCGDGRARSCVWPVLPVVPQKRLPLSSASEAVPTSTSHPFTSLALPSLTELFATN